MLWCAEGKSFYSTVTSVVGNSRFDGVSLEAELQKMRPTFLGLMRHPPKNPTAREKLKKASVDGIILAESPKPVILQQIFIEESLLLSDLFDLNEIKAAELLLLGEQQQPNFPGLPRGLCAVLVYYDNRRFIAQTLKTLVQTRPGRFWDSTLDDQFASTVQQFLRQLWNDGLLAKVLEFLKSWSLDEEMRKLREKRGLGAGRHQKLVKSLILEVESVLGDVILYWCAQTPLPLAELNGILKHLQTLPVSLEEKATPAALKKSDLSLISAALYCFDSALSDEIEEHSGEELLKVVPMLKERNIATLWQEITKANWSHPGLQGVFQMATAVFIRSLSHFDFAHEIVDKLNEDEEFMLEKSLEKSVLSFLRLSLLTVDDFHSEELSIRRFHSLIAGVILHFPLKIKELRTQTDEELRYEEQQEQNGMGATGRFQFHFEQLLLLISDLYKCDPLGLELSKEFWSVDESDRYDSQTSFAGSSRHQAMLARFLRSNAEYLPSRLYIAYLDMLSSLAGNSHAASQCFNFLNSNSTNGGSLAQLSWAHLFSSLNRFYQTLKAEFASSQNLQSIPTIAPTELKALMSWLKLMQKICENDVKCLLAFCERQEWSAMEVLFGFVGCPIPLELKGEIFQTLAVFATNEQLAPNFWVALHNCAALPILPEEKLGGVQVELDEVETRVEVYPVCRGFLSLLAALWGYSDAGEARPYLDYVLGSVLIRFKSRGYKNGVEMWQVGTAVIECIYNILHSCELKKLAALTSGESLLNSVGCQALIHLLSDPPVLKTILGILEDGIQLLDTFKDFSGKEFVEKSCLLCLKTLFEALTLESFLSDYIRQSGAAMIASSLESLLQTVNPRSGEIDYIVTIARYASHSLWLPEHSLYSVKILQSLSDSPVNHPKIVRLITSKPEFREQIRIGVVDCFDVESDMDAPRSLAQKQIDSINTVGEIRGLSALSVLQLLNSSVNKPVPNFAQFLLGFDMRDPGKTKFENPGTNGFPKTCLHVIAALLDSNLILTSSTCSSHSFSGLIEPSLKLLYQLGSSQILGDSTMRYLRNSHDFLHRHLSKIAGINEGEDNEVDLIEEQSWLLKLCSLELRCLTVAKQKSQLTRFVKLMFDESDKPTSGHQLVPLKIMTLIEGISLAETQAEEPIVEFFDPTKLKEVISLCSRQKEGYSQIDVQLLRSLLQGELASLQGTSIGGQTLAIHKEIQNILRYAVSFNLVQRETRAKVEMMVGWKQLISTALNSTSLDNYETIQERLQKLTNVFLQVLRYVTKQTDFLPDTLFSCANVILSIVTLVRQIVTAEMRELKAQEGCWEVSQQYVSLLDRTENGGDNWQKSLTLWKLSGLSAAFKLLTELLMKPEVRVTKTKVLLYGAFLSFSKLITAREPEDLGDGEQSFMDMSGISSAKDDCIQEYVRILNAKSYSLAEIFCKDAFGGNEILKTLALCCLNFLVGFGNRSELSTRLAANGHLQNFTDSLEADDGKLQIVLTRPTESLRPLYVYTARMAFLSALANTPAGANLLLQHNTVARLSQCRFFSLLPDSLFNESATEDPNSLSSRYVSAIRSALNFCLAIVNGVGSENREANVQILHFCSAHMDVLGFILQSATKLSTQSHLKLVELVTGVISHAATEGNLIDIGAMDLQGTSQHLLRSTMRIFASFAEFPVKILGVTTGLKFQFAGGNFGFQKSEEAQMLMELSCIRILNSLLSYGGRIVTQMSMSSKQGRPIFAPSFSSKESISGGDVSPSLYHLVQTLRTAVSHYSLVVERYSAGAKVKSTEKSDASVVSAVDRNLQTAKKLENLKQNCLDQLDSLYLSVELTLVLLWRHLNFYFCVAGEDTKDLSSPLPTSYQSPMSRAAAVRTPMRKLQESSPRSPAQTQLEPLGVVSKSVVDQLRIDMLSALDDGMINRLKKLNQMAAKFDKRKSSECFNEAVVRHIQRLIKAKNF